MKPLKDYFVLQQQIYDYFGYTEDWVTIPLDDDTDFYWTLYQGADGSGSVRYANSKELLADEAAGEFYEDEIYTQRFLPKWVYRAEDYTMICVDTHTDGNKYLRIFDNSKEVKA